MKKHFLLSLTCWFAALHFGSAQNNLPRVAIAGLGIESSTFSPAVTHEEAFHAKTGDQVFTSYPFMKDESPLRKQAQWFPSLVGKSIPGGAATREAYESLVTKMLDLLKKNAPYDGLYLDIHGAMSVQGLNDPEGDLITRIRQVVGYKTLVSTSMDLHGCVTKRLAQNTDLMTCYRMAPHEDAMQTKERAVQHLLDRLKSGKGKPAYKAWIPVPILLPGEQTSTRIEPGKSLYAEVTPIADNNAGIVDAGIWISYAWADAPRNHGVVMVVGDDKEKVATSAEKLAKHFWDVRSKFDFVAPVGKLDEVLNKAIVSKKKPFFISDTGDNPTAGAAGDVTWTITEILKRPEFQKADGPALIYASIPDPEFVKKAQAIGVGGTIESTAGAIVDHRFAKPVPLKGTIESIVEGDRDGVVEVVVKVGSVHVIVTQKRKPYHKEKDFERLGLKPREADIVVVKIGYLEPELYNMQKDWIMALTPGGVDQDLYRLPYKHIQRPMYPLDKDMKTPNLSAQWIPVSGK
ncbi:microcystin degradation protein MlrC [Siphonobacter sp. SORGH_AS_0500]|uniref:M81 family metallopeptidase n=1 Tax=Siphonobacter sp. SORGH_AS_0500 TaxID=1864824 RepID=UPI000CADA36F|nr:M81 family metallopeptidase [Siphonobacter sp. SORGH_AS_0500]PKK37850.1 microcystin degradation protein MlrC [Siphonobacter sp. SORGH_AS_0500]